MTVSVDLTVPTKSWQKLSKNIIDRIMLYIFGKSVSNWSDIQLRNGLKRIVPLLSGHVS